jgi:hypothetical protein
MATGSRTNSLHEKLEPELRKQVERDLVEQPPGRETYEKVWEYYELGELGISKTAIGRYGGYLRALARNTWISEVADSVVGQDLSPNLAGIIRSRLFETLTCQDTKIGDLMKAAIATKTLTDADARMATLKKQLTEGVQAEARRHGGTQVDAAVVADLIDKVMRGESV